MITREIEGMTFTKSLLDTKASIIIHPKNVGELYHFLLELHFSGGIGEEITWRSRRRDFQDR